MSITDKIFSQCVNLVANEDNQKKLRSKVIDPLVTYFKYKLKVFFIIIIILLSFILITNLLMFGYIINIRYAIIHNS